MLKLITFLVFLVCFFPAKHKSSKWKVSTEVLALEEE